MGSKYSLIQKIRGISAPKVRAKDDDSDEDDEHWEAEVDTCSNAEFGTRIKGCKTNHNQYIPAKDFIANGSLSKLPEDIRHESVLEYIKIQEKLVVRIRTNVIGDSCADSLFGTGCVNISTTKELEEFRCPLSNCDYNKDQAHNCYGGLLVYTNKHIIKDPSEAQSSCVDFFYYNEEPLGKDDEVTKIDMVRSDDLNSSLSHVDKHEVKVNDSTDSNDSNISDDLHKHVIAYGHSVRENKDHKDLVGLRILYHERELYTTVRRYSELTSDAWSKIPENIKSKLKNCVIIISHPHGMPKMVSFGDLICLEQNDKTEKHRKVTQYNAATCRGSSGAPVLTGRYPYRPFVHSSKAKFGASFSY